MEKEVYLARSAHGLEEIQSFLDDWRGSRAQIWDYQASLSVLTIQLSRPDGSERVVLKCVGTKTVQMPIHWDDCNLIAQEDEEIRFDSSLFLVDTTASVRVECFEVMACQGGYPQ
ncbi:MAG: hypothetical protein MPN21_27025 [Thermoanaerobaculia bacterium]|nr:hypothetical protein [Thermoanaerobaculia bacterium]